MSRRSNRVNTKRADNKRARIDSQPTSINQSNNECQLVCYSFLLPLVIIYLNDRTILGRLLHVCKAIKERIGGSYTLKSEVNHMIARNLLSNLRYLPVTVTKLKYVNSDYCYDLSDHRKRDDLSVFTSLTSVHYDDEYRDVIEIPDTVTEVVMPERWDGRLTRGMFPRQLKYLAFGRKFISPIEPGVLPSSLTELHFCYIGQFNHPIFPGVLPPGLIKLTISEHTDTEITAGVLPDSLEWLQMASHIACPLPRGLRHLELTASGNLDASFLPDTLTHLSLGSWRIEGTLPSSIVSLTARVTQMLAMDGLNTCIKLTHLQINCAHDYYEDEYDNYEDEDDDSDDHEGEDEEQEPVADGADLDSWMESVDDGDEDNEHVTRMKSLIPKTVTHLEFIGGPVVDVSWLSHGVVPDSVTHLTFRRAHPLLTQGAIPDSVTDLYLNGCVGTLEAGMIPSSVKSLYLGELKHSLQVGVIPASVETLIFEISFDAALPQGVIPPSVTKLVFLRPFTPLHPFIPSSVIELRCFWQGDMPVPVGAIPESVKVMLFGGVAPGSTCFWASDIDPARQLLAVGSIPSSVTELDMGPCYNAPIAARIIPASVRLLKLAPCFKQTLPPEWTNNPACYMSEEESNPKRGWSNQVQVLSLARSDRDLSFDHDFLLSEVVIG